MLVRPVVRFVQTIKRETGVSLPVTNECGNECFMTRMSLVAIAFVIAPWTAVAAPCPGTTPRVLDALKNECVRATFFLLGRNTTAHPQIARRALAESHSIGHHSSP